MAGRAARAGRAGEACSCRLFRPVAPAGGARRGGVRARAASPGPRWPRRSGPGGRIPAAGQRRRPAAEAPRRWPATPGPCRGGSPASCRIGFIQRAVAASPRLVSHPKASGSRRTGRSRICCMKARKTRAGVCRSAPTSFRSGRREVVECVAGGEHDPADRAAPSSASSWTMAPPVSLPTRVTS